MKKICILLLLFYIITHPVGSQDGFCMINGITTGGEGGEIIYVSDFNSLKYYATSTEKYIIFVMGVIDFNGQKLNVTSNKSIIGLNSSSKIIGNINISTGIFNVIIRNLTITNPYGDGVTIWGAHHVWVDHCTFYDCADGCCDITRGADYITISWCKFFYVNQVDHRFVMILGNSNESQYHVTIHHCWFADKCDQRMPSGSYSIAHVYNNYFSCNGNYYCTNARIEAQWRVEYNYYENVNNPCYYQDGGIMHILGNVYKNCTGLKYEVSNGIVNIPYDYTLDSTYYLPDLIKNKCGAILDFSGVNLLKQNNYRDTNLIIKTVNNILFFELENVYIKSIYIFDLSGKIVFFKNDIKENFIKVPQYLNLKGNFIVSIISNSNEIYKFKIFFY